MMQFTSLSAFAICLFVGQAMGVAIGSDFEDLAARQSHPVAFNVAVAGKSCGSGTTITCQLASGQSCKGNFSPAQASVVVTTAQSGCHVSLYPDDNQGGGVTERLDAGSTGVCVFTGSNVWKSYGIFC